MKRFLKPLIVVTALIATYTAKAQSTSSDKPNGWWKHDVEGAAGIQVGYRHTNLDQLNSSLNANGLPSINSKDIWINLTMSHFHGKWLFEDGLGVTPSSTSETNYIKAHYGQADAFFRVGYDIATNSDLKFFPFAGVNLTGAMLNIKDKARDQANPDFTGALLSSTASKTLYQGSFGVELGAGLDYMIKLKSKTTDCFTIERNVPIGIRAGYYIDASRSDWKFDGYKLQNGPNKSQNSVFVALNIGLGYKIKKQK